ncbi:hypothetical protein JCM10212_003872 [Sporobolomyces blumeae]
MATTRSSSPLSDLSEPPPPPELSPEAAPPPRPDLDLAIHAPAKPSPSLDLSSLPLPAPSSSPKKAPSTSTRSRKPKPSRPRPAASTSNLDDDEACPVCRDLDAKARKTHAKPGTVWVECDAHWPCVRSNPTDLPDMLDKWYCRPCLDSSLSTPNPLAISYKLAPTPVTDDATVLSSSEPTHPASASRRKSNRATRQLLDYSNLNAHLPASVDRWSSVIHARTASGQIKPDALERKRMVDITDEWVYGDEGMKEPFVVEVPEGLGMRMPRSDITVAEIAQLIGPETPLEVIDVASQSSLANWTLGQWAAYYSSPDRDKVRNVISLEVSDTKLGQMVVAPELVRKLDWVDNVWPQEMKTPGNYPRVQKYCLMSVERCWTDWHIDFAGSSVFYHILKGGKTFYFIRPTPANLLAYERWSGSAEKQEQEWLGDSCDEVFKLELKQGNTAFLPTGWIHAVYTPADSIVIGGNFLHSLDIPTQLRIYEIELATKVPKKFRYPHFVKLLWLVANHYQKILTALPLRPVPPNPLPLDLSPRVLDGLLALSSFLISQTTRFTRSPLVSAERRRVARENVPWKQVADPVNLSREFRKSVLRAMTKELDAECFQPHRVEDEDDKVQVSGGVGTRDGKGGAPPGTKRKLNDSGLGSVGHAPKSAKIKHPTTTTTKGVNGQAGSPTPPPPPGGPNQGEIIARHVTPVPPTTRYEDRIDPARGGDRGPRRAEVKETRHSQTVVRRWEEGGPEGDTYVETRTVHTIIERVRWSDEFVKEEEHRPEVVRGPPPTRQAEHAHGGTRTLAPSPGVQPPFAVQGHVATGPAPPTYPYPIPPHCPPQAFAYPGPPPYAYPPQPPQALPPPGQHYPYPPSAVPPSSQPASPSSLRTVNVLTTPVSQR